ncbi:MAG: hypothetical protein ACPKPY_00510 [Nitrososphaeraceae archaeon]
MRTFLEWYDSIPDYIKEDNKIGKNQETTSSLSLTMDDKIHEINCILKKLVESNANNIDDKKPTVDELKSWIKTNQL